VFMILLSVSCSNDSRGYIGLEEDKVDNGKTEEGKPQEQLILIQENPKVLTDSELIKGDKDVPALVADWSLVLEESFDKDLSNWEIWQGGAFNKEVQLYTVGGLSLSGGILSIKAQRKAVKGAKDKFNPNKEKSFDFVSGRIESKEKFGPSDINGEREYRISARIKLPRGFGMWPAFWTYANPWPTMGEIDILEGRGNTPKKFQSNVFFGEEPSKLTSSQNEKFYSVEEDLTADFHVYELLWEKDKLTILFDNRVLGTYLEINGNPTISDLFGKKHQIILNLAVGGDFFFNTNSNDYEANAIMEVDWVRVYKK